MMPFPLVPFSDEGALFSAGLRIALQISNIKYQISKGVKAVSVAFSILKELTRNNTLRWHSTDMQQTRP